MRSRVDPALLSELAVGLVVRLARIARAPLIHPAGPAYLALARDPLPRDVRSVAWAVRRQHRAALVAYVVAALLLMSPALLALHARSGLWQLSPREARLAATAAVGAEPTLVATLVHHPVALLARTLVGGATQLVYDAKALGVLLAVPFVVGLAGAAARATVGPLLVAACFTALPLAL